MINYRAIMDYANEHGTIHDHFVASSSNDDLLSFSDSHLAVTLLIINPDPN